MNVPRLGDKTFEQAAGFLRVMNGDNPLDASAVHPEAYPVVRAHRRRRPARGIRELIGDSATLRRARASEFTDEQFGLPTVKDILAELEKPGRDPRPEFKTADFQGGRGRAQGSQPGMVLEGAVTNVANFGAFVDIGVHQDGLVHISALANNSSRTRTGRQGGRRGARSRCWRSTWPRRIALTMRLGDDIAPTAPAMRSEPSRKTQAKREPPPQIGGAMAAAMAKLRKGG